MAVRQLWITCITVGAMRAIEGGGLEGPHIAPMTLDAACDITCDQLSKPIQHVNTYYDNTDHAHYQGHPEELSNRRLVDYDLDDCSIECVLTPKFGEDPFSTSQGPTTQITEPPEPKTSPVPTPQGTDTSVHEVSSGPPAEVTNVSAITLKTTTQPLNEYLPTQPPTTDWY